MTTHLILCNLEKNCGIYRFSCYSRKDKEVYMAAIRTREGQCLWSFFSISILSLMKLTLLDRHSRRGWGRKGGDTVNEGVRWRREKVIRWFASENSVVKDAESRGLQGSSLLLVTEHRWGPWDPVRYIVKLHERNVCFEVRWQVWCVYM